RVLQEREVERLGGRKTIELDVRVLATSNRDLKEAVNDGVFREDLYYRLNVFPLTWLPLAERSGDIVPLAAHLLQRHCDKAGKVTPVLSQCAKNKLMSHAWPGNVRELDNVVQRALILQQGATIAADDIFIENFAPVLTTAAQPPLTEPAEFASNDSEPADQITVNMSEDAEGLSYKEELQDKEHQIILDTLNRCNGKRKDVAELLGISPRTLRYKLARMRDLGLPVPA
ncbi:Fis family transcriptional regulator, partial [Pseudoalteromonas rubra]